MKLIITENAHRKIMQWVNMADFEVSGLGLVKLIDDIPTVTDAFLLEQESCVAETELNAAAIGKLEYEQRAADGELRFWWHSHVKMSCFWSGTDMEAIRQLGKLEWFYHTVFNQKGEHKTAFSCKSDLPALIGSPIHFYDDIKTEFKLDDAALIEACKAEYEKKVTIKKHKGPSETVVGGSTGIITDPETSYLVRQSEARWDFKIEVWDLMDRHWSNAEINRNWHAELKEHGLKLKDLREEWIETNKIAGMVRLPKTNGLPFGGASV